LYKDEQLEINKRQLIVNHRLALFTGALVVTSIVAGAISYYQARIAGISAAAAMKAAKASEDAAYAACIAAQISRNALIASEQGIDDAHRSSLAATSEALAATEGERAEIQLNFPTIQSLPNPYLRIGYPIAVIFQISNAGKTAAVNLRLKARLVLTERNRDPNFSYALGTQMYNPRAEPGPDSFNNSGGPESVMVRDKNGQQSPASNLDLGDYQSGKKDLIFFAEAIYGDIFGGQHWRRFCQFFGSPVAPSSSYVHKKCTDYNQSDIASGLGTEKALPQMPLVVPEVTCQKPE
jgi:hypothetical protein